MNKPPAFQFYADDFLAGVADMTQAEVGAYILLLSAQWSRGAIPTDPARAAMIAKGEVSPHVMAKFPGGMNPRLEHERQKQADYRAKQADNGRKGMAKRWHNEPITSLEPKHNSPSPSPSPIDIHTHTAEIPTWSDVQTAASMIGVVESSAKAFFDHHEGNQLWVNQHGKLINWKHKLKSWAENDRTTKGKTNGNTGRIAEKRVDRSIGTANEGIAHEYEGMGNMVQTG